MSRLSHPNFPVIVGAMSLGIVGILLKMAYREYTSEQLIIPPLIVGMLLLWGVSLVKERKSLVLLKWKDIGKVMVVAGFASGFSTLFYYLSLETLSVSLAIVLLFQSIWLATIWDCLLEKRRIGGIQAISVIMVLIGTLFATSSNQWMMVSWLGIVFGLLAALFEVVTIQTYKIKSDIPPILRATFLTTGSIPFILLAFSLNGSVVLSVPYMDVQWWSWIITIALFSFVIPPVMLAHKANERSTGTTAILLSIELPFSIAISAFLLDEPFKWWQTFGVILILVGIILKEKPSFRMKTTKKTIPS